ncbi:metallophosphoesterase 1 isoform X4 [Orcinus orca]|uniref:metallophosphoesterase 1 isoform X4 n=1 Tax=Orcinus orca TaxID=9733 RepID=UPI002112B88A|nr:metallophosphoesterase 1 isoform X4 [Orcinus orca]
MLIFWGREVSYSVIALKLKISQWVKYFAPSDGLQLLLLCVGPYRAILYTCFMSWLGFLVGRRQQPLCPLGGRGALILGSTSQPSYRSLSLKGSGRWSEPSRRHCGCCSPKSSSFWETSLTKGSGAPPRAGKAPGPQRWCFSPQAWADDVGRFWKIFRHPPHVQLRAVAGNHDIGFHYQMNTYKIKRFEKVFNPERLFSWKGINFCVPGTQSPVDSTGGPWLISCPCLSFVMVNSVALEGDSCDICSGAEAELLEISHRLNCSREQEHRPQECGDRQRLPASAPILLQHFPLYRRNDANCSGEDAASPDEKYTPFKERYDALSQEASRKLLWWLRPRLVLSGHTHSACEVLHGADVLEVSVPSFSWRNRNNPSFIMGSVTATEYALAKCYLPYEDTVLTTYCTAAGGLVLLTLVHAGLVASPFHFGWNMLRKFKTTPDTSLEPLSFSHCSFTMRPVVKDSHSQGTEIYRDSP